MDASSLVTKPFSISDFGAISLSPRSVTRNFPLQVEGYDITGAVHFVHGIDLSSGVEKRRVRVFLRDIRSEGGGVRPGVRHYATNPYAGLEDADFHDRRKMDVIGQSLEARCFTAPGGVLMVQSAFDDSSAGAVSAYWINRVVSDGVDLKQNCAAVLSPVLARLSRPVFPRGNESGKTYCACDILHTEKTMCARSSAEFDNSLFSVLSMSATAIAGMALVVIRLVQTETGEIRTQLLERRVERMNGAYVAEAPATTIDRFWASMTPAFASGLRDALDAGSVEVVIVPGTRYRLVGRTLELLAQPAPKRIHLPWERFALPNGGRESGFMRATVSLLRHKGNGDQPAGDDDFFVTGVWPLTNDPSAVGLAFLEL